MTHSKQWRSTISDRTRIAARSLTANSFLRGDRARIRTIPEWLRQDVINRSRIPSSPTFDQVRSQVWPPQISAWRRADAIPSAIARSLPRRTIGVLNYEHPISAWHTRLIVTSRHTLL